MEKINAVTLRKGQENKRFSFPLCYFLEGVKQSHRLQSVFCVSVREDVHEIATLKRGKYRL